MKLKKTTLFSVLEILIAVISIIAGVTVFILLQSGTISITNEDTDLGEGIGLVLGLVFYVLFMIAQVAVCVYMIIEGIFIRFSVQKSKNIKALFIVGGIIKILFCAAAVFFAILILSLGFIIGGVIASVFVVLLLALAVFGFVCRNEIKAAFDVQPAQIPVYPQYSQQV